MLKTLLVIAISVLATSAHSGPSQMVKENAAHQQAYIDNIDKDGRDRCFRRELNDIHDYTNAWRTGPRTKYDDAANKLIREGVAKLREEYNAKKCTDWYGPTASKLREDFYHTINPTYIQKYLRTKAGFTEPYLLKP